tara:strand:- start:710 stop:922 length:213 start_codon:yes stop_codon:yes gene_type:complete
MLGLFKFFLILTGVIYLLRWLSPFIVKYLLNVLVKKMGNLNPNDVSNNQQKPPKKKEKDMGEYIDYEEID